MVPQLNCAYVLPMRRTSFNPHDTASLRQYLERLKEAGCEVIVPDGSAPEVFDQHAGVLGTICRHVPVDRRFGYLNDKVNGIYTGIELASFDRIILPDATIVNPPAIIATIIQLFITNKSFRPQTSLNR